MQLAKVSHYVEIESWDGLKEVADDLSQERGTRITRSDVTRTILAQAVSKHRARKEKARNAQQQGGSK